MAHEHGSAMRFLLVHGGWQGGWCWDQVAVRLRAAGHEVLAPTLAGLGPDAADRFDISATEMARRLADDLREQDLRGLLGAFMFSGPQLDQPAGTLSGGEKTRLALAGLVASTANVLLLDEPTNNLDPASREQVLDALRSYQGAVVLVTHDPGAAEALDPQRVVLLPDGTEDYWSEEYRDLIELA